MSKILNFKNFTKEDYYKISFLLKKGGIIIYPTETIYGIGCNALNDFSIKKVYSIKKKELWKKIYHTF